MNHFKSILFDFGGGIIDLDRQACVNAFKDLAVVDVEKYLSDYSQSGFFLQLEKGLISTAQFRDEIRKLSINTLSDEDFPFLFSKFAPIWN